MAWKFIENRIGQTPIGTVDTVAAVPVGTILRATDTDTSATGYGAGEFIYLRGVASTAVGSWVVYNMDDGGTVLLAANAIGPVAVATAATVANTFGWYQITGKAVGLCLAGFLDDANVYATATAGSVDDAIVAGDRVKRAKGASARNTTTGLADFEIDRPNMDDGLAA